MKRDDDGIYECMPSASNNEDWTKTSQSTAAVSIQETMIFFIKHEDNSIVAMTKNYYMV